MTLLQFQQRWRSAHCTHIIILFTVVTQYAHGRSQVWDELAGVTPTWSNEPLMDDSTRHWVETAAGGPILSVERPDLGGSRHTHLVEIGGDHPRRLVVRGEAGGAFEGSEISVAREAQVYQALLGTAVPVPEVLAVAPGGTAVLMERLEGTGDLLELSERARERVVDELLEAVAALHLLDVEGLELPDLPRPTSPEDHARNDLGMWRRLLSHVEGPEPLLCYAGTYLHDIAPSEVPRTSLVQGDTGPGNLVATEHGLSGLVDMEFAHIGDPHDDLAWILYRCEQLGIDHSRLIERYTEHSGIPVNQAALDYYAAMVQFRCAVTSSLAATYGGARGRAPYLLATRRFLLKLGDALAKLAGIVVPEPSLPDPPDTPRAAWFDHVDDYVRMGPRGTEEERTARREARILLTYLRDYDRRGPALAEAERDDRLAVLGIDDEGSALIDAVERAGASQDAEVLGYLLRRGHRQAAPWSALLDG